MSVNYPGKFHRIIALAMNDVEVSAVALADDANAAHLEERGRMLMRILSLHLPKPRKGGSLFFTVPVISEFHRSALTAGCLAM